MLVQEKNLLHIKLAELSYAIILEMPLRTTGRTSFFCGLQNKCHGSYISSLLVLQHSAYFVAEKCLSYWLKVLLLHNEIHTYGQ